MNVLVVGGAGYVGSIIRPTLEREHCCRYLDLHPVPGAEDRTIVGNVNDHAAVERAVEGQDALLYLAMGSAIVNGKKSSGDIDAAFDVNVRGLYRVLEIALNAGIKRFCYTSSLSVYQSLRSRPRPLTENIPADSWGSYGLSKRVGEFICQAASQSHPEAAIVVVRLIYPMSDEDWQADGPLNEYRRQSHGLNPDDLRQLFVRTLNVDRPGCHIVQTTGDVDGSEMPNHAAKELLGWTPQHRPAH